MQRLDKHVKAFKPIANHVANIAHDKAKKNAGKMMRDDKDKVQEILFALFEKHQYYNIKDLAQETRQPMAYLREILNEVKPTLELEIQPMSYSRCACTA